MSRDPVRYHALAVHASPTKAIDAARKNQNVAYTIRGRAYTCTRSYVCNLINNGDSPVDVLADFDTDDGQPAVPSTLTDRVTAVVDAYPQWSQAERRRLPEITEEILTHCRDGSGNAFIREWCDRVLVPALRPLFS